MSLDFDYHSAGCWKVRIFDVWLLIEIIDSGDFRMWIDGRELPFPAGDLDTAKRVLYGELCKLIDKKVEEYNTEAEKIKQAIALLVA